MKPVKVEFVNQDYNCSRRSSCSVILSSFYWLLLFACILSSIFLICLKILPQLLVGNAKNTGSTELLQSGIHEGDFSWKMERKSVLILGQGRSGSSFLGEIFNQHPEVMYLYEPLHAYKIFSMTGIFPSENYGVNALQVLFDIFNCHFSSLQDYLTFISFPELSSPHFRTSSKIFSSPPFCKHHMMPHMYDNESPARFREICPQLHFKKVSAACMTKKSIVVKDLVHRMPFENSSSLERLIELQPTLHLVYLVRDPRAVITSMKKMGWIGDGPEAKYEDVSSAAIHLCKQTLDMLWGIDRWSARFGTRVQLVRYEDLASDAVQKSEELFKNIGMSFPSDVRNWIKLNTNSHQKSELDPYRVDRRNATLSLHAWRLSISNDDLVEVQDKCLSVMSIMRYNTFEDVIYLRDLILPSFRSFS